MVTSKNFQIMRIIAIRHYYFTGGKEDELELD